MLWKSLHVSFVVLIVGCTPRTRESLDAVIGEAAATYAFVDIDVVSMKDESIDRHQTVLVRDGRILAIGSSGSSPLPEAARRIDGRGRYLLPGLADMHAHAEAEYEFSLLLANGVTTIRNMWGEPKHLQWREAIESGKLLGPTIYTAGPIIDGDPPMWPGSAVVTTVEQARATVLEQKNAGYDFLKVYNGSSREGYDALVAAAREHHIPVVGHVPHDVGLLPALESGLRSIEHLEGYDSALLREGAVKGHLFSWDRLEERRFAEVARRTAQAGTWNCPTLVVFQKWIAPKRRTSFVSVLLRRE